MVSRPRRPRPPRVPRAADASASSRSAHSSRRGSVGEDKHTDAEADPIPQQPQSGAQVETELEKTSSLSTSFHAAKEKGIDQLTRLKGWLGQKKSKHEESPIEPAIDADQPDSDDRDRDVDESHADEIAEAQTTVFGVEESGTEVVPSTEENISESTLIGLLGSRQNAVVSPGKDKVGETIPLLPFLQEKKRSQRKRWWVTGASVVAVAAILISLVLCLFIFPVFALKADRLEVTGVEGPQKDKIISDSQSFVGKPILGINKSAWKSVLKQNLWVKDVEISRHFPHSAVIKVYPREPAVLVIRGGEKVAYDEDGIELRNVDAKNLNLPLVEIKAATEDFKRAITTTIAIMRELPDDIRGRVKQYIALSPMNVQFVLHNGAVVKWGSREDSALKSRVLQVLLQVKARVYDVTSPSAPVTS